MITFISGGLIQLITFPGIIIHEIAHRLFCDLYGVPVFAINYFDIDSSNSVVGHVTYQPTKNSNAEFFINIGPFIINTLLFMILTLPYCIKTGFETNFVVHSNSYVAWAHNILAWIGLSIGFHAIPSQKDLGNVLDIKDNLSLSHRIALIPI